MTKKIKQSIDKIRPSLTSQQNNVLTSEQQNLNKDFENVMGSAKAIQEQLEEECGLLKEYKNLVDKVSSVLDRCKYNEEPVQNVAGLYYNVDKIALVLNDLLVSIAGKKMCRCFIICKLHPVSSVNKANWIRCWTHRNGSSTKWSRTTKSDPRPI